MRNKKKISLNEIMNQKNVTLLKITVKMTLISKDDISIYQIPHKSSQIRESEEENVNKQLKILLNDSIIKSSSPEYIQVTFY